MYDCLWDSVSFSTISWLGIAIFSELFRWSISRLWEGENIGLSQTEFFFVEWAQLAMEERITTQAFQQNNSSTPVNDSNKIAGNYSESVNLSLKKYSKFGWFFDKMGLCLILRCIRLSFGSISSWFCKGLWELSRQRTMSNSEQIGSRYTTQAPFIMW